MKHLLRPFLFLLCLCHVALAAQARPDMVIFLADDLGRLDCSPYGAKDIRTPHMQRLADAGMTFENAYVASPSCAPSRAALLTGMMPARNGAEPNHSRPRADIMKWPAFFQALGYEVAAFGKVSHYKHTADYGFDHFARDGFHEHEGIAEAVTFLKNRPRAGARPLCLFVGSNWPHVPWPEQSGYDGTALNLPAGSVDTPVTQAWRARYAEAVSKADAELGSVMAAVQECLPAETIFAFTSDHGAQWPFGKWNLYESGVAVPLMVAWPGKVKPGCRSRALVQWTDLLPTFLEAAGGLPAADLDGRSFLPVLRGEKETHQSRLFTTHSGDGSMNVFPMRAMREGRWKYILNLHPEFEYHTHIDNDAGKLKMGVFFASWQDAAKTDPGANAVLKRYHQRPGEELYDLESDPHEQRNLASEPAHAERLAAMRKALDDWMKAQGDTQKVYGEPRLLPKVAAGPAAASQPAVPAAEVAALPEKKLPLPGEVFAVQGRPAFLIPAKEIKGATTKPWVWYAPTLPGLPGTEERWMFEQFRDAGIAIAGIDVGESYGSPDGRALFTAFYTELTGKRGLSPKPVLLGRSRGGLMTLSWAAENADKVGGFAGIYPVCNVTSYPGIEKAAPAYKLTREELTSQLAQHNPVDRLDALARAKVPLFAIHGDVDKVVPLEQNSGLVKSRYEALGGAMELIIPAGQGHNMWKGFFECAELVAFVKRAAGAPATPRAVVAGYVPLWDDAALQAERLDFSKVTHLNVAFVNPKDDLGTMDYDPKVDSLIAKAHASGVKVLYSIGGGSASGDEALRRRYEMLMTDAKRAHFVRKLAAYAADHGFDGVDVDIEGPAITANYGPFIQDLAAVLKQDGKLLTAALSKGYGGDQVPADVLGLFDLVHIMAYDATGPWAPDRPGQHSSLEFARESVRWWLERGLKPERAVLGVPFYGYGFGEGMKGRHFSYAEIVKQWPDAALRDESGKTVFYNGIATIEAKCRFAKEQKLAGMMIWPLPGDAAGEASLLNAMHRVLASPASPK